MRDGYANYKKAIKIPNIDYKFCFLANEATSWLQDKSIKAKMLSGVLKDLHYDDRAWTLAIIDDMIIILGMNRTTLLLIIYIIFYFKYKMPCFFKIINLEAG